MSAHRDRHRWSSDGTAALLSPEAVVGARLQDPVRPSPQHAGADRGRRAGRRARRARLHRRGGGARALGRAVAGLVQLRFAPPISASPSAASPCRCPRCCRRSRVFGVTLFVTQADPELAQRAPAAADPPRRRRQQLDQHDLRLCRRRVRSAARRGAGRPRRAEARDHRRRALGRHRLRPSVDRQQFRLRPHSPVGARRPGRRLGDGRNRPGIRAPHQRPRDRDRDVRPRDASSCRTRTSSPASSRTG